MSLVSSTCSTVPYIHTVHIYTYIYTVHVYTYIPEYRRVPIIKLSKQVPGTRLSPADTCAIIRFSHGCASTVLYKCDRITVQRLRTVYRFFPALQFPSPLTGLLTGVLDVNPTAQSHAPRDHRVTFFPSTSPRSTDCLFPDHSAASLSVRPHHMLF